MDSYVRDGERYSYEIADGNEPNFASRVLGYTLYYGIRKFTGDAGVTYGNMSQYWRDRHNNPTTRYSDVLHSRINDISPPAVTRTGGGKKSQNLSEMSKGGKPNWYGPNKHYAFTNSKTGKVRPWNSLTTREKGLAASRHKIAMKAGWRGANYTYGGTGRFSRPRGRGPMTVRGRGGRTGSVRTYRAPTNYAVQQRGGGNYLSRPIRTAGGSGKVMRYKAFVGTLVFKTATGFTELSINSFNCGGQVYHNPSIAQYFGATPFQIQARLYEHFKWVSLCVEFSTRLPTSDTTGVIWGASDDPLYFKKVGVANSTINVTKAVLLAMSRSGTFNAWTPRVCVPLPIDRRWKFTAGPDVGGGAFDYADASSAQRDAYGGCVGITLEGTTPASDLQVANVWFDQKILVRRIGSGATTQVNAHEIKVPLEKKEKYDKAMALVNDDNFDVDRCLADLKLVDDTVRIGEDEDEKIDNWRWLKKYGATSVPGRPSTPTPSVKSDKSVNKVKSSSLK
jgi:hypothetical protein